MSAFLTSLVSGDERLVDSVIVCGIFALLTLTVLTALQMYLAPTAFSPGAYVGAAAPLIGTVAAAKTGRDRWASGGNNGIPSQPSGQQ